MKTSDEVKAVCFLFSSRIRMLHRNAQRPPICHPERSEGSLVFSHIRRRDSSAWPRNDSCDKVSTRRERMKVRVVNLRRALTPALSRVAGEGVRGLGRGSWRLAVLLVTMVAPLRTLAAELRTVTVLSYPDRPAKLPLWLAQDAVIFKKYGLNV